MAFEITSTLEKYVSARGKVILNACPGSGKTAAIAYKLSQMVPSWENEFGKHCGITCLSFTNVAKDEIAQKYAELTQKHVTYPHTVATIDSFINLQITLPNYYLLGVSCKRPKIIDDSTYLNEVWPGRWNYKKENGQLLYHSYAPSKIERELDGTYSFDGKFPDTTNVSQTTFAEYCKDLKIWQTRMGILKTTDSAYIALYLLKKFPRLAEIIATRFPIIIVDEAQDTSEIQMAILDVLANNGLYSLELVGDPYQCLYEWRNAKPSHLLDKIQSAENWTVIDFTDNRRSTIQIVDCFSRLRRRNDPAIQAITKFEEAHNHPLYIFTYPELCEHQSLDKYLKYCSIYKDNRVLVRGNSLRDRLLGGVSIDQDFWKSPIPIQLITAFNSLIEGKVKDAVGRVRRILPQITNSKDSYLKQKDIEQELAQDHEANALLLYLLKHLPGFDLSIKDWTKQTQEIFHSILFEKFKIHQVIDFELKKGKYTKLVTEPMEKYYGNVHKATKLPISTIHQVKGLTLDSVLLFLSDKNNGQQLGIKDLFQPSSFPNEKQRLMYVAMSRPRYLLAFALPDTVPYDGIKLRLGEKVIIE